jgi:hypothetical protein
MNEPDKRSDTALARCGISELALVIHQLPAAALTASRAGSPASHVKLIRPYLDAYGTVFIASHRRQVREERMSLTSEGDCEKPESGIGVDSVLTGALR